jgi:hypothetical protein
MKQQNPQLELPLISAHSMARSRFLAAAIVTLVSLFTLGTLSFNAQSGRRSVKPPATPTPTPEPTPAAVKPAGKDKAALTLIVGMDSPDNFAYIPQYFYDDVLQGCAQRLDQPRSVNVDIQRTMTRSDAIKRAKAEKENPVVLLRLRSDNISANNSSSTDLSQLYIEYFVFAPTTAKVLASGNAYPGYGNKSLGVPPSSGSATVVEIRLKQAARDAAERILDALHISVRPPGPLGYKDN